MIPLLKNELNTSFAAQKNKQKKLSQRFLPERNCHIPEKMKLWETFLIYLLHSIANAAQIDWIGRIGCAI